MIILGGIMKKVYKLADNYFNIEKLKNVTELSIVNEYENTETRKKIDKEVDAKFPHFKDRFTKIPPVHIYNNYEKNCKTATITIDDKNYGCGNYILQCDKGIYADFAVTEEQQAKYDEFVSEAQNIVKAFAAL